MMYIFDHKHLIYDKKMHSFVPSNYLNHINNKMVSDTLKLLRLKCIMKRAYKEGH